MPERRWLAEVPLPAATVYPYPLIPPAILIFYQRVD